MGRDRQEMLAFSKCRSSRAIFCTALLQDGYEPDVWAMQAMEIMTKLIFLSLRLKSAADMQEICTGLLHLVGWINLEAALVWQVLILVVHLEAFSPYCVSRRRRTYSKNCSGFAFWKFGMGSATLKSFMMIFLRQRCPCLANVKFLSTGHC